MSYGIHLRQASRLLEELLASRINQPLAYLWLNADETQEQACIRCGYDPSMVDRIKFVRWLTRDEVANSAPTSPAARRSTAG